MLSRESLRAFVSNIFKLPLPQHPRLCLHLVGQHIGSGTGVACILVPLKAWPAKPSAMIWCVKVRCLVAVVVGQVCFLHSTRCLHHTPRRSSN